MELAYLAEKRYSYHAFSWHKPVIATDYQAADPATAFERKVRDLFLQGYAYLGQEEYYLALNAFRELQNLILTEVHPTLPADAFHDWDFVATLNPDLVDSLIGRVAESLQTLPIKKFTLPPAVTTTKPVAASIDKELAVFEHGGLGLSKAHVPLGEQVGVGLAAIKDGDWKTAASAYEKALALAPAAESPELRGQLLHDLAILSEKAGGARAKSVEFAEQSASIFNGAKNASAQVHALQTVSGILARGGDAAGAEKALTSAGAVADKSHLFPVITGRVATGNGGNGGTTTIARSVSGGPITIAGDGGSISTHALAGSRGTLAGAGRDAGAALQLKELPVELMITPEWQAPVAARSFQIAGTKASIALSGNVQANVTKYLDQVKISDDLRLVAPWSLSYIETVAYIPTMYFYVIPMAIGDCLVGLGNREEADTTYKAILAYPYINQKYELPKLWQKMARNYLALGDQAYRRARDTVSAYGEAKAWYEKIITTAGTLNSASPLYQDSQFSTLKSRVQAFITAGFPKGFADNPALLATVLEARLKLGQIQAKQNFFGFGRDYLPPFNWEYLQSTAKYFAQQAAQIESRYIQFKSQAENETLQREQLDQQAEVARQTVELEERGLAEAEAGVDTANASLSYAETQLENAKDAANQFDDVRDELYEYAVLEAWASASAVDKDDQVQLTISGYSHYNADHKARNKVLKELAAKRTAITHDMEAARLDRLVESAESYIDVANAQIEQAEARVDVAQQRIAIAELQQQDAEENRDFLDMKEFSARLWYDLAKEAKRIKGKYLDMATEVAFLTERAYNAETERGVKLISFDYSQTAAGDLLGADQLQLDLDAFTLDYLVTSKTKKAPVKRVVSLSEAFPTAFRELRDTGRCFFQTELETFDRENPGLYLAKVRNVELIIVGVSNAQVHGTLRNVGVSKFRLEDGSTKTRLYPADVLPLSQYEIRNDALAFRVDPKDLRLFENNGLDTLWRLDLPLDANDLDLTDILDVQVALYFDGHFSPSLESSVRAALPATGSASRSTSLLMFYPDEMFYLGHQGEAEIAFDASLFPRNQIDLTRTRLSLRLVGDAAVVDGLKVRLRSKNHGAAELTLTADASGLVKGSAAGDPLGPLLGEDVLDTWSIAITAADNPGLVTDGRLDLSGLHDVQAQTTYDFKYR